MLLNLLRVEGADPQFMISQSFRQFQNELSGPELETEEVAIKHAIEDIQFDPETESSLVTFSRLNAQLQESSSEIQKHICNPANCLKYMQPGRLVKVVDGDLDYGYGVVVDFERKQKNAVGKEREGSGTTQYVLELFLRVAASSEGATQGDKNSSTPAPATENETGELVLRTVVLQAVSRISSIRLYLPKELRQTESRLAVLKSLNEVLKRYPKGPPLLDPVIDMNISDESMVEAISRCETLDRQLAKHDINKCSETEKQFLLQRFQEKKMLKEKLKELKRKRRISKGILFCSVLRSV
jgi:ATP-dependent RNA helicase DOB1